MKVKEIVEYINEQVDKTYCVKHKEFKEVDLSKLVDFIVNLQESEAYYYGSYKDYKRRIDKAIEYIENLDKNAFETNDDVIVLDNYLNDLLNILKESEE